MVSGKSHSAENLEESFTLAKRFVSGKNRGGASVKTNFKSRIEKTQVFKKAKIGYSVLGLRKPNFKTKIIPFEKSHNAKNCGRAI